ncbi:MAG: HNH endonuclease [Anaerolineae bacterium]|nr:HNH endonuclease [Anaerolineae bacterium]
MLLTSQDFIQYFERFGMTELCRRVLEEVYYAPNQSLSATEVAQRLGLPNYQIPSQQISRLGMKISRVYGKRELPEYLNEKSQPTGWQVLFTGEQKRFYMWIMRPELAEALEAVYQFGQSDIVEEKLLAGEAIEEPRYLEGGLVRVRINRYERNPKARRACLDYYGYRCAVCGMSLEEMYGEAGQDIIHVHHLQPISERQAEYEIDPIRDLRPVCPNCHAIIHSNTPHYSIKAVQEMLRRHSSTQ